jgi:hypothetical protein
MGAPQANRGVLPPASLVYALMEEVTAILVPDPPAAPKA